MNTEKIDVGEPEFFKKQKLNRVAEEFYSFLTQLDILQVLKKEKKRGLETLPLQTLIILLVKQITWSVSSWPHPIFSVISLRKSLILGPEY